MSGDTPKGTGVLTWFRRREEDRQEHEQELQVLEKKIELERQQRNSKLLNQGLRYGGIFLILIVLVLSSLAGLNQFFKLTADGIEYRAAETEQVDE